jgi:hypothetical protein
MMFFGGELGLHDAHRWLDMGYTASTKVSALCRERRV